MRVRSSIGLLAVTLASIAPVAPAYAHAKLMSSSPAAGQVVAPPTSVTLRFDDVVQLPPRALRITGTRGNTVAVRASLPDARTLEGSLPGELPRGQYVVRWRIVADDGHIESGSFGFAVRAGARRVAAVSAGNTRATSRDGGTATVLLTVGLSLVTIIALGVGLVRIRWEQTAGLAQGGLGMSKRGRGQ
jgi:methionine-rich copper-binding protein CopC